MNQGKLTLEHLFYGIIFILAIFLRLVHLGQPSLNDYEASQALQALQVSTGSRALIGDQPGYGLPTALIFRLFDATDFAARFWPALAGACMVWLPLLFRKVLPGRVPLWLSFFLAIDPAGISIARTASAESLAVLASLAALGFLLQHKPIYAGVFLGIALCCGSLFWSGILVLVLAFMAVSLFLNVQPFSNMKGKDAGMIAGVAALTAGLLASGFLFLPNGITGIANGLLSYLGQWGRSGILSLKTFLLLFVATYLPVLILSVYGLIQTSKRQKSYFIILLIWVIIALALVLLRPDRQISEWIWVIIPLWIGAAFGMDSFTLHRKEEEKGVFLAETVLTVSLLLFGFLNLLAYLFNSYGDPVVDRNRLIGAILPVVLLIIVTTFLAWGWSRRSALKGLKAGIGFLLMVWVLSAAMKSSGFLTQPSSLGWKPQSITTGERLLVSQVEELSLWNHGNRTSIDIEVVHYDFPSLRWALRKFPNVYWEDQFSPIETPSVIIAPDYQQVGSTTLYRGQAISWGQLPAYPQMKLTDWIRWTIYRKAPVDEVRLIIYARNDLFKQ